MKRSILITVVALASTFMVTPSAQAHCPLAWLNPLTWLGFYHCGGCGHSWGGYGYACGYGYRQPVYQPPVMHYPAAPACDCYGASVHQPSMQAVRVPVTTYRAVTQYVPQTTYRTQYQYGPSATAYATPVYGNPAVPQTAYVPMPTSPGVFSSNMTPAPLPAGTIYQQPTIPGSLPQHILPYPNVASPITAGDISGDHEFPIQSSAPPQPAPTIIQSSYSRSVPLKRTSYGVTPRRAQAYPSSIR